MGPKTIAQLLEGVVGSNPLGGGDLRSLATSVTSNSKEVKPGTVFVAVRGQSVDGHAFIRDAQQSGAVLIVGEEPASPGEVLAPYLQVKDSRLALAQLAGNFFGHPTRSMKVIGVTGTSGKTTTTYLIESILKSAGFRVGVIGTVNFRFGEKVYPSTHTTPGPVELQGLLAEMRSDGCDAVVMEVSSHSLKQHRVAGIAFDGMIFKNLSPEHLDFHPDMEDYYRSKRMLFSELARDSIRMGKSPVAAMNVDDPYGKRLLDELKAEGLGLNTVPYRFQGQLKVTLSGIRGDAQGVKIESGLMGAFNAYNILAAVSVTLGMGITPQAIAQGIADLKSVPGRLELVSNSKNIHVLVDYAHKPDALEKVLNTLREIRGKNRLITVFGCGGDRDRKKRPVMGGIAVRLSDQVIITSDNPRTEDPSAIIREIVAGTQGAKNVEIEADRKKAIFKAISAAKAGDIVVIAGKGHEDYQIVGKTKYPFDDRVVAAEALNSIR